MVLPTHWKSPLRPICVQMGGTGDHVRFHLVSSIDSLNTEYTLQQFNVIYNDIVVEIAFCNNVNHI